MPGSSLDKDAHEVRAHFHKTAKQFDAIYNGRKSILAKWLDNLLRWDMYKRLEMTLDACKPIEGKQILDIGCGTGRFCIPLAQQGAGLVVGIDFAENMISEARKLSEGAGVGAICRYEFCDFLEFDEASKFDHVLAIGLFDYIKDGRHVMRKMRALTEGTALMTFPRADTLRAPIRRIRLKALGCPVYFYSEKRIRDHLMIAGFTINRLMRVGELYFVEAS